MLKTWFKSHEDLTCRKERLWKWVRRQNPGDGRKSSLFLISLPSAPKLLKGVILIRTLEGVLLDVCRTNGCYTLKHGPWCHIILVQSIPPTTLTNYVTVSKSLNPSEAPFCHLCNGILTLSLGDWYEDSVVHGTVVLSGVRHAGGVPQKPVLMYQEINWQVLVGHLLCAQHGIRSVATGPNLHELTQCGPGESAAHKWLYSFSTEKKCWIIEEGLILASRKRSLEVELMSENFKEGSRGLNWVLDNLRNIFSSPFMRIFLPLKGKIATYFSFWKKVCTL